MNKKEKEETKVLSDAVSDLIVRLVEVEEKVEELDDKLEKMEKVLEDESLSE